MKEANFKNMIAELRQVKSHLDDMSRDVYKKVRSSPTANQMDIEERINMIASVANSARKMKSTFSDKYRDFIAINSEVRIPETTFRYQYFFFDACRNTRQLHLYFEFIELFIDVYGSVKRSLPNIRRISPESIKSGIASYYALLFTIKKIRKLYQKGVSLDELKSRFPMVSDENLERFTLDSGARKGWAYKASEVALGFASHTSGTTVDNFRQILKKEKDFSLKVKALVGSMENVELTLAGELGIPIEPDWSLKTEIVPDREWIDLFRWGISHLGPMDTFALPPKKR